MRRTKPALLLAVPWAMSLSDSSIPKATKSPFLAQRRQSVEHLKKILAFLLPSCPQGKEIEESFGSYQGI